MPSHRSADYLPGAPSRRPLFRSVRLNVVGWATVAGLCVAGAAIGLAAAHLTGVPPWLTAPAGAAVAFAAMLAADRRKWNRNTEV